MWKRLLIVLSIFLLLVAGALFGLTQFSITAPLLTVGNTVEIDTGTPCETNYDCETNSELPSYSYCEQNTCRFIDERQVLGDVNEI